MSKDRQVVNSYAIATAYNHFFPFSFRSLLEPAYEKIKAKLKNQVECDLPKYVAISIDAWTAHHHGYMGLNIHYIHNFVRKKVNLACSRFDDNHTAVNIWKFVKGNIIGTNLLKLWFRISNTFPYSELLEAWNLLAVTLWGLRDGAQNMVSALNQPGCFIIDIHCLIHAIMLVIDGNVLSMASVKKLIGLVHDIVSHAQMSNLFYAELFR